MPLGNVDCPDYLTWYGRPMPGGFRRTVELDPAHHRALTNSFFFSNQCKFQEALPQLETAINWRRASICAQPFGDRLRLWG